MLTASILGRERLLDENIASVRAQTLPDWEHLILVDHDRNGCAASYNLLAEEAKGTWLFILADDDLMLPGCLDAHLAASGGAEIVYGRALVWGEDEAQFVMGHPDIPATAMILREVWERLGGYEEELDQQEDRHFFQEAVRYGVRFSRITDRPTWVYRFHGGNKSRHNGEAS